MTEDLKQQGEEIERIAMKHFPVYPVWSADVEVEVDANALRREDFALGLRYARDNGYLSRSPSTGEARSTPAVPSVEEIMGLFNDWRSQYGMPLLPEMVADLRARLTQALRSPAVDGRSGELGVPLPPVGSDPSGLAVRSVPAAPGTTPSGSSRNAPANPDAP